MSTDNKCWTCGKEMMIIGQAFCSKECVDKFVASPKTTEQLEIEKDVKSHKLPNGKDRWQ